LIYFSGDDIFGRKVIVFSACRLPPHRDLDHNRFLQYVKTYYFNVTMLKQFSM